MAMTISPAFTNRAKPGAVRVRWAFGVAGSKVVGTVYFNGPVPAGADVMARAELAAAIVCKRAGADTAELLSISNPTR